METELVATITISQRKGSRQLTLRVQDARGKWHETTIDRHTSIGWQELKFIWGEVHKMLDGQDLMLPF